MNIVQRFIKSFLPTESVSSFGASYFGGTSGVKNHDLHVFADEGYKSNPIVYRCINLISKGAACANLYVKQVASDGTMRDVENSELYKLLSRPNPQQTLKTFLQSMFASHRYAGEVFILANESSGKVRELYLLDPSKMKIEANRGTVTKYVYGTGANAREYPVDAVTGRSQVKHIKTFNPIDSYRGLSPLFACATHVDIHNSGARWNYSLLKNGARPTLHANIENATDEQAQMFREMFRTQQQGAGNNGDVVITSGGVEIKPLSLSPTDMDFSQSMTEAAKNIALVFGVPLPLVTNEAATFSNMDAAQEQLWEDTIIPLLDEVIPEFSDWLCAYFGERLAIVYDVDHVPALQGKKERLRDGLVKLIGSSVISPDEAREALGYEPRGGAAEFLYGPSSNLPLDLAGIDEPI